VNQLTDDQGLIPPNAVRVFQNYQYPKNFQRDQYMYDILELSKKLVPELREIAKNLKINRSESLKKQDLIYRILDQQAIDLTEKNLRQERIQKLQEENRGM
jgi:hypothetical protein